MINSFLLYTLFPVDFPDLSLFFVSSSTPGHSTPPSSTIHLCPILWAWGDCLQRPSHVGVYTRPLDLPSSSFVCVTSSVLAVVMCDSRLGTGSRESSKHENPVRKYNAKSNLWTAASLLDEGTCLSIIQSQKKKLNAYLTLSWKETRAWLNLNFGL